MNRIRTTWSKLRRLTKVNLIIGGSLLVMFAYVATTVYFGAASQVKYESNDFPGAQKAATAFLKISPFERHIGYFNRGTAEAAVGDLDPAQTDLESALDISPERDECAVRINLSYVYEKLADESAEQDAKKADELYAQALKTLEDAPEECQPKKSEEKEKSDNAKKRVEEKKDAQPSDDSSEESSDEGQDGEEKKDSPDQDEEKSDGSGGEPKSEQERKREELRERGEKSDRDQQQQRPGRDGGRTTPEKPW